METTTNTTELAVKILSDALAVEDSQAWPTPIAEALSIQHRSRNRGRGPAVASVVAGAIALLTGILLFGGHAGAHDPGGTPTMQVVQAIERGRG